MGRNGEKTKQSCIRECMHTWRRIWEIIILNKGKMRAAVLLGRCMWIMAKAEKLLSPQVRLHIEDFAWRTPYLWIFFLHIVVPRGVLVPHYFLASWKIHGVYIDDDSTVHPKVVRWCPRSGWRQSRRSCCGSRYKMLIMRIIGSPLHLPEIIWSKSWGTVSKEQQSYARHSTLTVPPFDAFQHWDCPDLLFVPLLLKDYPPKAILPVREMHQN